MQVNPKRLADYAQVVGRDVIEEMRYIWQRYNEQNAHSLEGEYDLVIVHDPQPAGLMYYHGRSALRVRHWIWRCHIDTSTPNMAYWTFLLPYLEPYDAHVSTMQQNEINAFQTLADVVIQKSTREGFGLTVTEALWKGKPVIGGNVGGIPLQVLDGDTGYLVDSVESCAARCLELLREPDKRQAMGQARREHVRRNYHTTRLVHDDLNLFRALSAPQGDIP